jgi:hypothetical protein
MSTAGCLPCQAERQAHQRTAKAGGGRAGTADMGKGTGLSCQASYANGNGGFDKMLMEKVLRKHDTVVALICLPDDMG